MSNPIPHLFLLHLCVGLGAQAEGVNGALGSKFTANSWKATRKPGAKGPLHGCIGGEFDDEEECSTPTSKTSPILLLQ